MQNNEECLGAFKELEVGDVEVAVVLSRTYGNDLRIVFSADSPEAEVLTRELSNERVGQKLGIMKVNLCQHPILIRRLSSRR